MRKPEPKPKVHQLVPIPERLRAGMREIYERLQDAKRDSDIPIGFDDAMQSDGLYGGRCSGIKGRPFLFTYRAEGTGRRNVWRLTLHRLEIEDIADGVIIDLKMYCCMSTDCENKFREAGELCTNCDYIDTAASASPVGGLARPFAESIPADLPVMSRQPSPSERPMATPLGKKLRAKGYVSLWDYLDRRGFTDFETFRSDIDFQSLAPAGFCGFVVACTLHDKQWSRGFRFLTAYELNASRKQNLIKTPSPDWTVASPTSSLWVHFKDGLPWARDVSMKLRDHLLAHRELFDRPFSYNDAWLIDLVPADPIM